MASTHPTPRGIPILSGPPPVVESESCRQCARDFNYLFRRGKVCGHCGYEYCSSCLSDGQALMPRRAAPRSSGPLAELREAFRGSGNEPTTSGYDPEPVCVHCLAMLQVTAAPLDILRALPLKRLKEYLTAYNIPTVGIKEKEGLVEAVYKARNPTTGTLRPENESFYRRRSVPRNGRPPEPRRAQPNSSQYQTPPSGAYQSRPPPPNYRPPPQARPPPAQSRPAPAQPRPPAQSQPRPPPARATPPPPVPSILSLVALPKSYLSSLSIGTLKAILYENHVRVDFKQVLEKEELIGRVAELVADERKRLERQRREEEREAAEAAAASGTAPQAAAQPIPSSGGGEAEGGADANGQSGVAGERTEPKLAASPPTGPAPDVDRGLCVVCQDEEATLAVVDCGHLAMCSHCSDLIMATSKECPLCRTRIVTPQRLIRIYRV